MHINWYKLSLTEVCQKVKTNLKNGLTSKEATKRLANFGPNMIKETKKDSLIVVFLKQFNDLMVLVLLATIGISALLGEVMDALAILAIVILNAVLGFIQEYRAEKSLEALKDLTTPISKVMRDGKLMHVQASALVPGDIILLEAGDRVPADCRLFDENGLGVNEAALTGESVPVDKRADFSPSTDKVPLGDQANMLFMGTLVTKGRCKAIVVGTGMDTEIGRIAGMIQDTMKMDTPLQQRLAQLGKWLVLACLVFVVIVFVAGIIQGFPIYKMFLIAVSLAVAAIPEGLPAAVTIALALGVQRMIRCNAIVRQLPAVETLGCATVICSDKTGTLTENQMTVQKYWLAGEWINLTETPSKSSNDLLEQALRIGCICTNAQVTKDDVFGDPTEVALIEVASRLGVEKSRIDREYELVKEIPFDSIRKRMSVLVQSKGRTISYVKGAPDIILERCTSILTPEGVVPLSNRLKKNIIDAMEQMGDEALRVLGLGFREMKRLTFRDEELEERLTFVGLVGMIDPPRPQARRAVLQSRLAGIRTIMVTGDHKKTATAIAKDLGLLTGGYKVMTGNEWEALGESQQREAVKRVGVFARVAPQHKLSIVRALKANGEIVGMTGDGVNDAPAVKEADIGISMGITGTDVTKEASSMVLADDNFETIIKAIREGRIIYDNIRKFIRYLLSCNVGEVLTMFLATISGLPLPLIPIQILWMNLVTDGLPAIALGVDPGDDDIMERPPRSPKEGIFSRRLHLKILFTGIIISLCTLAAFVFTLVQHPSDLDKARTIAFTTLVMAQLVFVFECRSEYHSIFEIGLFGNTYLVLAVACSAILHVVTIYHPWFQKIFQTVPLDLEEWLLVIAFSGFTLVLDTIIRIVRKKVRKHISLLKV
ncbi:MAG: calcium-transporting P-type ATPase, PMR1-type [Firmicutes bacterium]|nr:calcium-transporting P-type ATPase, PMR1-type [Bacillota bacterium]